LAATHRLTHPAIIVIGEVAGLAREAAATGEMQKGYTPLPVYTETAVALSVKAII
jgi:hypothetical protein